jgi:hypothetical protein
LYPHSSPSDARARVFAMAQQWSGPALVALGLVAITVITLRARESPFAGWILTAVLAPERVLPLIGLGAACARVGTRIFGAALQLFVFGIAVGLGGQDWLLWVLYNVPGGPTHLFLTGPISCLAIGLVLVPGARLLPWLLPVGAFVAGAMLSLAIFLTDPSLHDPAFTWTPLLAAFWIVTAVGLTLRAFWRGWFAIFGRILGSWLVAIGLLYGGASLLPVLKPPPPPVDTSGESTRGAELKQSIQKPSGSEQLRPTSPRPDAFSGGVKRLPP